MMVRLEYCVQVLRELLVIILYKSHTGTKSKSDYNFILVLLTMYRSDGVSIVILDDIDQLVKHLYFGDGRASVSHDLMHAVSTLITATPPVGKSPCSVIM